MKPVQRITSWSMLLASALLLAACVGQVQSVEVVVPTQSAKTALKVTSAPQAPTPPREPTPSSIPPEAPTRTPTPLPLHPLSIEYMRKQVYPGSDLIIEETLAPGSNYNRYVVSYKSEELKIYALLTVPRGTKPENGWPVVIFNHGYIPPAQYRTTERYVAYVDAFARNGYIVLKSDYRGHGNSEGSASGGYGSPAYTIDVLNAISSIKRFKDADSNRIGMWGHSMGGQVTLRAMVVSQDIKAGVIWAGVVASYPDMFNRGRRNPTSSTPPGAARGWRGSLVEQYGTPEQNPVFWNSISPNAYLRDLTGPVQLHHGTGDTSVPYAYSETLNVQVQQAGKTVEFYTYNGDDHNLSHNLTLALRRSVQFFDRYMKGG